MEIYQVTYTVKFDVNDVSHNITKLAYIESGELSLDIVSDIAYKGAGGANYSKIGNTVYFDVSNEGIDKFNTNEGWSGTFKRFHKMILKAINHKKKLDNYINKL